MGRGVYLRLEDEYEEINMRGIKMKVMKKISKGAPQHAIGHLDDEGEKILDLMLAGNESLKEIIEFFKFYKPKDQKLIFIKSRCLQDKQGQENDGDGHDEKIGQFSSSNNKTKNAGQNKTGYRKKFSSNTQAKNKSQVSRSSGEKNLTTIAENAENTIASIQLSEAEAIVDRSHDEPLNKQNKHNTIIPSNSSNCVTNGGNFSTSDRFGDSLDANEIKNKIPFMHPDNRKCSFRTFFDCVEDVVGDKGLDENKVLDVEQSRMGGGYKVDMVSMRSHGNNRDQIENYFLQLDDELERKRKLRQEQDERMTKLLQEESEKVELHRQAKKVAWGLEMGYHLSSEYGLLFQLNKVESESSAWQCGLRSGDYIVSINDWMTTKMDKPEVALHLFEAASNRVVLDILKSSFPINVKKSCSMGLF